MVEKFKAGRQEVVGVGDGRLVTSEQNGRGRKGFGEDVVDLFETIKAPEDLLIGGAFGQVRTEDHHRVDALGMFVAVTVPCLVSQYSYLPPPPRSLHPTTKRRVRVCMYGTTIPELADAPNI